MHKNELETNCHRLRNISEIYCMSSKLLIQDEPLLVLPELAVKVGLNEALFLQQVHYWLNKSNKFYEGRTWIYNTVSDWSKQFPFWSERTIRRIIGNLEKQEILIIGNFNKLKMDRTQWYSINHEKLEELDNQAFDENVTPCGQSDHMEVDNLTAPSGQDGQMEVDNLATPIPETTQRLTTETTSENFSSRNNKNNKTRAREENYPPEKSDGDLSELVDAFEQEFGTLSPTMLEELKSWVFVDHYDPGIIKLALQEAVLNQKTTMNYIKGILRNWKNDGIETILAVQSRKDERFSPKKPFEPFEIPMDGPWNQEDKTNVNT